MLKFLLKLQKLPQSRIGKQTYDQLDRQGKPNWATDIKTPLCTNGYGIVWLFHTVGCETAFFYMKTRLIHPFDVECKDILMYNEHNNFYSFSKIIFQENHTSQKKHFINHKEML